eukprot:TRINITY_DN9904_c0_g3_i1.p2 TRINITY_DN9904_c0_g3~~TRINITY_DN9904_c0_g3_i1.p2  ORF type:complete len:110 (-),score=9.90 TRINITY_DN9904_c0_g3_i1:173-502(-)
MCIRDSILSVCRVDMNKMGREGRMHILKSIVINNTLAVLNLGISLHHAIGWNSQINDDDIETIIEIIKKNKTLVTLNLGIFSYDIIVEERKTPMGEYWEMLTAEKRIQF